VGAVAASKQIVKAASQDYDEAELWEIQRPLQARHGIS
jgi:hypothetical protein